MKHFSQASLNMRMPALLLALAALFAAACSPGDVPSESCTDGDRVLNVGFYAYFDPVSHSADPDPASEGFNTHRGYEADLLTALEAMEGAGPVLLPARHRSVGRHLAAIRRPRV